MILTFTRLEDSVIPDICPKVFELIDPGKRPLLNTLVVRLFLDVGYMSMSRYPDYYQHDAHEIQDHDALTKNMKDAADIAARRVS